MNASCQFAAIAIIILSAELRSAWPAKAGFPSLAPGRPRSSLRCAAGLAEYRRCAPGFSTGYARIIQHGSGKMVFMTSPVIIPEIWVFMTSPAIVRNFAEIDDVPS